MKTWSLWQAPGPLFPLRFLQILLRLNRYESIVLSVDITRYFIRHLASLLVPHPKSSFNNSESITIVKYPSATLTNHNCKLAAKCGTTSEMI